MHRGRVAKPMNATALAPRNMSDLSGVDDRVRSRETYLFNHIWKAIPMRELNGLRTRFVCRGRAANKRSRTLLVSSPIRLLCSSIWDVVASFRKDNGPTGNIQPAR